MAAVPMYLADDCPVCAVRLIVADGRILPTCADCHAIIPSAAEDSRYFNMQNRGFQSFTWDHEHISAIDLVSGRGPAYRELCLECKDADFLKRYPKG